MSERCSSTARVNSPEEMPNSSSLVWFLSELFPVGRALQSAARSTSMNHLNGDAVFFSSLFFYSYTFAVRLMFLSRKRSDVHSGGRGENEFLKRLDCEEPAVSRSKVRVPVFVRIRVQGRSGC